MDSAEFLDLLGNANRRRILRLLARKPCYVTEISEQLGVSPKAVIDHLEKLEDAGLVESRTDDRRRKYFSISRHISLEVTVSPYKFGTRSAYPPSSRVDIASVRQVSLDLESAVGENPEEESNDTGGEAEFTETDRGSTAERGLDLAGLARQLHDFEQLERELSLLHRWAEGRITDLRERLADQVDAADPRLVTELLVTLAEEPQETTALARQLGIPPQVVGDLLDVLATEGIVRQEERRWRLVD